MRQASAEDNSLHVFFEMLWYASLLSGVIASSILFMVLLTALPLTSARGYWTERIAEILKRIPTTNSVIAVPLLAAAIGGGALAGSIAATEPGGQGRGNDAEQPPKVRVNPTGTPDPLLESRVYREGDQYTWVHKGDPLLPQLSGDLDQIVSSFQQANSSLEAIRSHSKQLLETRQSVQSSTALAFWLGWITPQAGKAESKTDLVIRQVEELSKEQRELSQRVETLEKQQPLAEAVAALVARMEAREKETDGALRSLQNLEEKQNLIGTQSLGQTAAVDTRGFWRRTFGGTLYAVGPSVASIMDAYLAGAVDSSLHQAMAQVLLDMRSLPPCARADFEETVRCRLIKTLPDKDEKTEIDPFLKTYLPALLKISALPRY